MLPKIKNKLGKNVFNRKDIAKTATNFYRELYQDNRSVSTAVPPGRTIDARAEGGEGTQISVKEVHTALCSLKSGRAPGPDMVENESLKLFRNVLVKPLAKIFNCILSSGLSPLQWKSSEIILLHKKGDRADINNYRPISLSSNVCKVFMKIIKNKIYPLLDEQQSQDQAGFRKGYSTTDHIHTLGQILEKSKEFQKKIAIMFVDFNKAFDSLFHDVIWQTLKKQNIPDKIINIIKEIYENSQAKFKIENSEEFFEIKRGVKQGDPLSPNLFNAVLENVFRELHWANKGIRIDRLKVGSNEECFLNNLRFGDDIVLVARNREEI